MKVFRRISRVKFLLGIMVILLLVFFATFVGCESTKNVRTGILSWVNPDTGEQFEERVVIPDVQHKNTIIPPPQDN